MLAKQTARKHRKLTELHKVRDWPILGQTLKFLKSQQLFYTKIQCSGTKVQNWSVYLDFGLQNIGENGQD